MISKKTVHVLLTSALTAAALGLSAQAPVAAGRPDFAALADRFEAEAVAHRRTLHEKPELALRERDTQVYLKRVLEGLPGVTLVGGEWGTGVVAILTGGRPGPLVAWRTDMDALPITEKTGLPYASVCVDTLSSGQPTGVMHACGHDLHMAVALGMMRLLSEVRGDLPGRVLLIGQPAEENGAGARMLLKAGLFDEGRHPRCVIGIHDHPTIPCGKVGSCPGSSTANVDGFSLLVRGKGGHGAYPHETVDPVTLASRMVLAFQDIVTREIDVKRHCVITVGRIQGGTKGSVIPDEVRLDATVRSQDDETRQRLKDRIARTVQGLADAAGAPVPVLDYYYGTPAGYNDPRLVGECRAVFRRVLGEENEILYESSMGGEDFSRYGRVVPAFQFRLGVGRPEREMSLHSADFDPDERAIRLGILVAAEVVWDQLQRGAPAR